MKVVEETSFQIGNYKIKPYQNGLCWEVFEYREVTANRGANKGKISMKWVSSGKYPTTFGHALEIVYESMLKEGEQIIDGLPEAIETAKKIRNELLKQVK